MEEIDHTGGIDPLVSQALVYGDRRPYPVALITLQPDDVLRLGREAGLAGRTAAEVVQAPADSTLKSDESVPIVNDRVYVVRSRATAASFSGCQNYAKLEPLEIDVEAGLVTLRVIGNARCNDLRLVEVD